VIKVFDLNTLASMQAGPRIMIRRALIVTALFAGAFPGARIGPISSN